MFQLSTTFINQVRSYVVARIESIFESVVDALLEREEKITFVISSRTKRSGRHTNEDGQGLRAEVSKGREISFPGKTSQEAWQFSKPWLRMIC